MDLFGRQIEPEAIASVIFMLLALVLWIGALRDTQNYSRWFRDWEARRKARRDAERLANGETVPDGADPARKPSNHGGPWG
jgi:hypothetical protein